MVARRLSWEPRNWRSKLGYRKLGCASLGTCHWKESLGSEKRYTTCSFHITLLLLPFLYFFVIPPPLPPPPLPLRLCKSRLPRLPRPAWTIARGTWKQNSRHFDFWSANKPWPLYCTGSLGCNISDQNKNRLFS